jgi:hypothetical protein
MKKTIIILFFIFTLLPTIAFSQQYGCLRGGYIYFVLDAEGDDRDGYVQYELNYSYELFPESSTCYRIADPYPSCYVDNNIGSGSGLGTLVTYGTVYCPIDDNTWALLAFSIVPVFIFRKKIFNNKE